MKNSRQLGKPEAHNFTEFFKPSECLNDAM